MASTYLKQGRRKSEGVNSNEWDSSQGARGRTSWCAGERGPPQRRIRNIGAAATSRAGCSGPNIQLRWRPWGIGIFEQGQWKKGGAGNLIQHIRNTTMKAAANGPVFSVCPSSKPEVVSKYHWPRNPETHVRSVVSARCYHESSEGNNGEDWRFNHPRYWTGATIFAVLSEPTGLFD